MEDEGEEEVLLSRSSWSGVVKEAVSDLTKLAKFETLEVKVLQSKKK